MSLADSHRGVPPPAVSRARSATPDDLSVRIEAGAVFVRGVIDASTSHLLLAAIDYLQAAGRTEIRVDLAEVRRIESEGIRVLFDRQNALADAGGDLRILAPPALLPRLILCRVERSTRSGTVVNQRQRFAPGRRG
jgi:anti-anti-sigma factor